MRPPSDWLSSRPTWWRLKRSLSLAIRSSPTDRTSFDLLHDEAPEVAVELDHLPPHDGLMHELRQVLVSTQAPDGSWQEGHVGPVYTTAINCTILQLGKGFLPIYQR
jgi:hypothetical protein